MGTSIAYWVLMANCGWALLRTPIINLLEELYLYFKFLNVLLTRIYNIFKANYLRLPAGLAFYIYALLDL